MILAAFVSFCGLMLLLHHLSSRSMRRLVGYKGFADVAIHGTIIMMFLGTSTIGLIQAEAAGILFSVYLRGYCWAFGYERLQHFHWHRFAGKFT